MADFIENLPGVWRWVVGDAPAVRDSLAKFSWKSPIAVAKVLESVLRGISQVALANNPLAGLLILIGLFVGNVNSGLGAIVCSLTAIFVAKVLNWPDDAVAAGHSNFNAVLIGTVTTALYTSVFHEVMPPEIWGYMMLASAFTVCVMAGLGKILEGHNVPALTLPFNIVVSITFLCMLLAGYRNDPKTIPVDKDTNIKWDQVFKGTLLAAGHVWAVESVATSCLVYVALFIFSPILTIISYMGATLGTLSGLIVSEAPYTLLYSGVWGYNGFLSAAALSLFMVPTPRILLLAAINAVFATFIQAALLPVYAQNHLPIFTFPFCLASVVLLATAMTAVPSSHRVSFPAFPELHYVRYIRSSPESPPRNREENEATTEPMV